MAHIFKHISHVYIAALLLGFFNMVSAGEVGPMYPAMPAPKGMTLIYETHFNQVDVVTGKPENFYLEMFMGKPHWFNEKEKKGPSVLMYGRSKYEDKISEFEERYTIVGSNCDETSGKIQKTYLSSGRSREPVDWAYLNFEPRGRKIYPKDVSSYDVIATKICQALNPYFEGMYKDEVRKKVNDLERLQREKFERYERGEITKEEYEAE